MPETSTEKEMTSWYDGKFFKGCLAVMPFIRWAIVAAMFIFGAYMYQRDTNAAQRINVVDLKRELDSTNKKIEERGLARDKQMEKMLTREVFEAYHSADIQRMERIENMLQQILEHQSR